MKKLIQAMILIAGVSAGASAYAQAPSPAQQTPPPGQQAPEQGMPSPERIMAQNDKNTDGVITKAEAEGSELVMFFDMVDGDHDGKITMDELKAIPPMGPGGPPPGGPPPGGPPPGGPPASQGN